MSKKTKHKEEVKEKVVKVEKQQTDLEKSSNNQQSNNKNSNTNEKKEVVKENVEKKEEKKNVTSNKKINTKNKEEKIVNTESKINEVKEEIVVEDKQNKEQEEQGEKDTNIKEQENKKEETVVSTIETSEDETTEKQEEKDVKVLKKYTWAIVITAIVLLIVALVLSTAFGIATKNSTKIISGVSVGSIDVSNLTKAEAVEKLNNIVNEKIQKTINLSKDDYTEDITLSEIDTIINVEESVNIAYNIGRNGKILKDNFQVIDTYFKKIDIKPSFSYNEEKLSEIISTISDNLPNKLEESGYYVEDTNLIISKGKEGFVVDVESLKNKMVENISNISNYSTQIEIPVSTKQPEKIDIEKIHNEIYKEAQNAYYTKDPFTVYPHVDGVDFDITIEEANNLLNGEEQQITIPLKIITPAVTTNQIGTEAFPNLLSTYSTTFSTSNVNRSTNIRLAAKKVNGVVLMPGEEFSYNKVVGQRTAAAGYKSAAVYSGGKVVNGIGGGICQVSSTLYNAILRANLQTVKRSNHRFATGYVPLSTDATVSWGGPEFIFKNSRKYPIKIVCQVIGGKIKVDIYGCKEEVEYDVEIKSETLQIIPSKVTYRVNTALPKGTTKKIQSGHAGYKSRAYRILKLNGNVISKELLSTDTYAQLETIIEHNP